MNRKTLLAIAASCVALAACGGGGGGGGEASTGGVPNSAQTSVGGLITYLQQLIGNTSDTGEPVSLDNVTLPVDDTAEPTAI